MRDNSCNIMIGGEAGQGLVTVSNLLAKALVRHGYYIVVTQTYESRIRGGHNTFAIRVSVQEISASKESVDLLVALDENTVNIHKGELVKGGLVIANAQSDNCGESCLGVPYKELASPRSENVAALGVLSYVLGLKKEIVVSLLHETFGKKNPAVDEENTAVFEKSFAWASSKSISFNKLPAPRNTDKRLMMCANDAIAFGAMSAGIKFHSFYPMTPSTSIGLTLAAHAKRMGIVVEQAEDEIAVINMAIGASFAGAPAMVSTAGGGFALMVEGVSLAAMTETPLVIVVGQRPAPATGLPTRTEQGDFEFVLHAGHGEFPRVIFAPGTIEECFDLTRRAFEIAEKYQGPVFILTDQFIADSYRAVKPFDLDNLQPIRAGDDPSQINKPYKRYALTESGISPRILPGLSEHLVVADSDEHTESGHITENLSIRKMMVEKRLKKMEAIRKEIVPPDFKGDDKPDILFVSWGSTKGSVFEAVAIMRDKGKKAAAINFSQVWPIDARMFIKKLEEAKFVVCVEGNATGQFAKLIRRETGFVVHKNILRYDGLPITPEFILNHRNHR